MPDAQDEVPEQSQLPADPAWPVRPEPAMREGLSWSWDLDFEALMTALTEPAPWHRPIRTTPAPSASPASGAAAGTGQQHEPSASSPASADPSAAADSAADSGSVDPVEAEFADLLEAMEAGRSRVVPLTAVAGRVAETLPAGPDLAGWLGTSCPGEMEDGALAGIAASYRRLASWAQAGELAVVAQLASRSAEADKAIGVDGDGRPAQLPDEACAQISLALTMSQAGASWWTDLAVTLRWRLPATFAKLRTGDIDLARARLIAEATAALDEDKARAVEAKVLPSAGEKTTGQLRAALRRAVITEDPDGAEKRREDAERKAKVGLYPDPDGTASLAGVNLNAIHAAAAMARITALAKAIKAGGATRAMDLLRAEVFLGLLLGTLPHIPPAPRAPPGTPPPEGPPDHRPPEGPPEDQPAGRQRGEPRDEQPAGRDEEPAGRGARPRRGDPCAQAPPPARGRGRPPDPPDPPGPEEPPDPPEPPEDPLDACDPGPPGWGTDPDCDAADLTIGSRPPAWPDLNPVLSPGPAAMGNLGPVGRGILDLTVPWSTLAGQSAEPGTLTRIGPITPTQARHLANLAAAAAGVQWRIIITDSQDRALAVTRLRPPTAGGQVSLLHKITLTIPAAALTQLPGTSPASAAPARTALTGTALPDMLDRALRAAATAAADAQQHAAADTAAGGCAHTQASESYQPPPRLRDHITARDLTCRSPTCRQPAWRCDLDHTIPYDQGGRTCRCNLGGLCRFHHQLKQNPSWQLTQPTPGTFAWTTPAGRTYYTEPDTHAA